MTKKNDTIDILAFGAHPDDVEACAAGFLIKAKKSGFTTGIVDMTRGEGSNFGTTEERDQEAKRAAQILKLTTRINLGIPDAGVHVNEDQIAQVITVIRQYKPSILLFPYYGDLHPDHAATGRIGKRAAFFSKIQNYSKDINLPAHQPQLVLYYMLHTEFKPSFVLDISIEYELKQKSMYAHTSQFFKKGTTGYTKQFHNAEFMEFFESRSIVYGYKIGAKYGEPYLIDGYLGLSDITSILSGDFRSLTGWKKK